MLRTKVTLDVYWAASHRLAGTWTGYVPVECKGDIDGLIDDLARSRSIPLSFDYVYFEYRRTKKTDHIGWRKMPNVLLDRVLAWIIFSAWFWYGMIRFPTASNIGITLIFTGMLGLLFVMAPKQ